MPSKNTITGRVELDINDFKKQLQEIEKQAEKTGNEIDNAFKSGVKLNVDTSELDNATNEVEELDGAKPKVTVETDDSSIKEAQSEVKELDGQKATIDIEANDTGLSNISELLSPKNLGIGAVVTGVGLLTNELIELGKEVDKTFTQINNLTGLTGESLTNAAAQVSATSSQFEVDAQELATATNNLAKAFDSDFTSAGEVLQTAFALGGDATGELLAVTQEYGSQVKAAGLELEEFLALQVQTTKEGIFSDKGIDAIKEATLRLRELPQSTKDALSGIGLDAQKLGDQISEGLLTPFDAIQLISSRLDEFGENSTEVGTILADVFGGAGEDAGLDFIKSLDNIDLSFQTLIENATETQKTQLELAQATTTLNEQFFSLFEGTGDLFRDLVTNLKIFAAEFLQIINFKDIVNDFRDSFSELFASAKPTLEFIAGVVGGTLVVGIELLTQTSLLLIDTLTGVFNTLNELFSPIVEVFKEIVGETTNANEIFNILDDTISGIFSVIGNLVDVGLSLVKLFLTPLLTIVKNVVDLYKDWIGSTSELTKETESTFDIFEFLNNTINNIKIGIEGFTGSVRFLIDNIGELASALLTLNFDSITDFFKDVFGAGEEAAEVERTTIQIEGLIDAIEELNTVSEVVDFGKAIEENTELTEEAKTQLLAALEERRKIIESEIKKDEEVVQKEVKKVVNNLDKVIKVAPKIELSLENVEIDDPETITKKIEQEVEQLSEQATIEVKPVVERDSFEGVIDSLTKGFTAATNNLKELDFSTLLNGQKELEEQVEATNLAFQDQGQQLVESLNAGEISYNEYIAKVNELENSRLEKNAEINAQIIEQNSIFTEVLAGTFQGVNDALKESSNQILEDLLELQEKGLEDSQEAEDKRTELYENSIAQIGSGFAQLLVQGELTLGNFTSLILDSALNLLNAQIPLWTAQIFGTTVGELGPIGVLVAGGLTAALTTLVNIAKSALTSAKAFEKGGIIEGGEQLIRVNEKGNEFVMNATATKENLGALEHLNNGGKLSDLINPQINLNRNVRSEPQTIIVESVDVNLSNKQSFQHSFGNAKLRGSDLELSINKQKRARLRRR